MIRSRASSDICCAASVSRCDTSDSVDSHAIDSNLCSAVDGDLSDMCLLTCSLTVVAEEVIVVEAEFLARLPICSRMLRTPRGRGTPPFGARERWCALCIVMHTSSQRTS